MRPGLSTAQRVCCHMVTAAAACGSCSAYVTGVNRGCKRVARAVRFYRCPPQPQAGGPSGAGVAGTSPGTSAAASKRPGQSSARQVCRQVGNCGRSMRLVQRVCYRCQLRCVQVAIAGMCSCQVMCAGDYCRDAYRHQLRQQSGGLIGTPCIRYVPG